MRAKGLLQFVLGPRQLWNLLAVKEPGPVTARDLEQMPQREGERPCRGPVPCHRAQQTWQAPLHSCSRVLCLVAEDMRGPMDPALGNAHVRPQGGSSRQAPLEEGLQPREGLGQGPLFSTRSRLSAMASRRAWSLRPEATKGGCPSSVRALRTAPHYPRMTSASGSVRPSSCRAISPPPMSNRLLLLKPLWVRHGFIVSSSIRGYRVLP